jgi:integrase/recombinase XerD
MTGLRQAAENYLVMRRALGFKLITQGRHLMRFVDYCEARHADRITTELAVDWARGTLRGSDHATYLARRLMVVRIFARHMKTLDPATEVPPEDVLPQRKYRIAPYLYSPAEINALIEAASGLTPPLRAATWQTLIGLLAVTGMRTGEACRLDRDRVNLDAKSLVIEDSKFGKSRRLFLHPSTVDALRDYEHRRDMWCPTPATASFFVSTTRGTRLDPSNVHHTFARLVDAAGIATPAGRRPARMHDLRHSFTVATLLDFYRDGGDVQARLPILSTWLGHVDPKSTYWYLHAIPELLALAADRLDAVFGEQP